MHTPNPKDTTPITIPQRSRASWSARIAADAAARRTEARERELLRATAAKGHAIAGQPLPPPTP